VSADLARPERLLVAAARALVPKSARRAVRLVLSEAPYRIRDALPDFFEILGIGGSPPLPPPKLRRRVGRTSSRKEFVSVGRATARDLREAFESVRDSSADYGRWLDFGCGTGRIARFVDEIPVVRTICGVDVDEEAIRWDRRNLATGSYLRLTLDPSLPLPDASFDVVFAVSVFSHLAEESQREWLREVHRVLRPDGLFLASTHSEKLRYSRPDLTLEQHQSLNARGFLFARGNGAFKNDSTFHTSRYLEQEWGQWFRMRLHREFGLAGYQDLTVWQKPDPSREDCGGCRPAGPVPAAED
jgi:SAM-dependent methyltransferase